jgi:hypothetical protein
MKRIAKTTMSQSGTRRFERTRRTEYSVATARSAVTAQSVWSAGTTRSGTWMASDSRDHR